MARFVGRARGAAASRAVSPFEALGGRRRGPDPLRPLAAARDRGRAFQLPAAAGKADPRFRLRHCGTSVSFRRTRRRTGPLLATKSRLRTNWQASLAPASRSMPTSSHSTDSGPCVADLVQRADDLLEIDAAAARRAEFPAAARIAKLQMAAQNAAAAVERDDRVLDVDVINAVGKRPQEFDRIDPLPEQMAGIEIEAELFAADRAP